MAFTAPTIGELNTHFTTQEETKVTNSRGGVDIQWVSISKDWGRLEATSGLAQAYSNNLENKVTHKITIRNNNKMKRGMRMFYQDFYVTVVTIISHSHARKRYMELLVTQHDAEI